jgi:predicted 3-demethylubiquinone-9 3-methyltransferase (glyoxalase superfamily)
VQITPFLWFDNNVEDAMDYYAGIFPDFRASNVVLNGPKAPGPDGGVMMASFELCGQQFMALNGGPLFPFTEAVSFFVSVDTQDEVDYLWTALTADGGAESQCGWLKDKFGLSWQIVPKALGELMGDPDPAAAGRVVEAMMGMRKIDIAALQAAHDAV